MKYSKEMSKALNKLLQKTLDAEKGFRNAADDVKSQSLKAFFKEKALQRYDFSHELKTEIRNFGEPPTQGSSIEADAHRTWMDLKAAFSGSSEEAILQEAERGEKTAVEEYNSMMKENDFPPSTENLLLKQRNAILDTIEEIKSMEKTFS